MSNGKIHNGPFAVQNWKSINYKQKDPSINLKRGIWIYFLLLIFEGAIRRYIPPLATPFLIIRDPVAIWCIFVAWKNGLLPQNVYLLLIPFIGIIGIFTALLTGHGNFLVAIFGARPLLFHFPMIFVIGKIFNRDDVIKIGKVTLWISIPMVFLIALQFYSPQSAWINQSLGDSGESGRLTGALGYYRPPGTFSFTTGLSLFYSFVTPFVIYFLLQSSDKVSKWVLIGSILALVASIPLSISRGLLFQVGLSVIFSVLAMSRKPRLLGRMLFAIVVLAIILSLLSNTDFFKTATLAFSARIDNASGSEGGVESSFVDRFLGGAISAITNTSDLPFFGYGIGMGTNAGSQLLTGNRTFLIAEGEWGRVIGEMGILMGFTIIYLRFSLIVKMSIAAFKKLSIGDLLPWMLLSFGFIIVLQGSWSQPTSLGFGVIIGGLTLASLNLPKSNVKEAASPNK